MQLQVETQIYKKNGVGKDINAAQTTANNALSNSQAKYAISSTGASQTIKIAYFEPAFNDWELFNGAEIFVKFTNKATNIDVEEVDRDQLPVLSLILFPSETIVDNYINATVEEKAEYETKYKVLSIIDSDGNALSPICYWETPNSVVHLMCDGTHWRILDIVSGKKYNDMIITIDEFSNTIGDQITHINADLSAETSARESSFRQTATSIESVVANNTTYTAPDGTIKTNTIQSAIKQNADDILLRVEKDGVIAAINASVEEEDGSAVKISADKVNITGTTIFNSQDFQELANAAYDAHGAAAAVAATIPDTSNLATKGEAVYRTQRIYQRRTAATNLSTNETWLTTSGTGYENWSLQIPPLTHVENNVEVKYLYLYTAVQTQTVTQYNSGALTNNCSCSPVLLDETTTVIDGGSIITHSIDANKISVQNLSAISAKLGLIKAGKIQNGDAGTNFIDFGDGTAGSQATLEFKNDTTWVNATQGIKYDSGQLLIKGHINATSLTIGEGDTSYDAIDAINVGGYTIEINENSSNNDITDFNSQTYIYPILYHNGIAVPEYSLSEDLEITDNSKTYYTRSGNEGNYIYTVVTNPTGNPHTNNYYERFDYTNFIWFRDGISFQTGSSIDGGIVASYGHTYRVTYEFADGAAGEGGSPVQTVTVIDTRYITEINKAGIKIHPETGNNINYIQLDGTGMEVVSGGISRAKYGVTSRIGKAYIDGANDNESHLELDYHSLQMIDREGVPYFWVSDLRGNDGEHKDKAILHETFSILEDDNNPGSPNINTYYLLKYCSATGNVFEIKVDGVIVSNYEVSLQVTGVCIKFTSTENILIGSEVIVAYYGTGILLKAFTFGSRRYPNYSDAPGPYSIAMGRDVIADGHYSFATGYETEAYGENAHAEGNRTKANGFASHAEGESSVAAGVYSHAEGHMAKAIGECSHAEGMNTYSKGEGAHAEGYTTISVNVDGISVGIIQATGDGSHAEGCATHNNTSAGITASGPGAHAEGYSVDHSIIARGKGAHSEGCGTGAYGDYSHAQNYCTEAYSDCQTTLGKYNSTDHNNTYAVIIGNGTSYNATSNALTVAWNGNTTIAGTLTQSSDRRLKEHISYLNTDAINFIQKLKPAHFKKDNQPHLGFYAQDVESVDPWHCMAGEMNGFKTLGYTEIIAPLVAYCQHLEERIKQLEEK
jgi:hypothetical protein